NKTLLSIPGLFFKLNKATIISWLIAFLFLGAAYGSIYGDMQTFIESNEMDQQMFTQSGSTMEESFTGTIMMVLIGLVSILPVVIINKLFAEENRSHLSQMVATKVTRAQLYWSSLGIAIFTGLLSILFAAGSLGGVAMTARDSSEELIMNAFLAAGYNFYLDGLVLIGFAVLSLGWVVQLLKVVYVYLFYVFMIYYFEGLLVFSDWLFNTAVHSWIPQRPMVSFGTFTFAIIIEICISFMVMGNFGYSSRD